MGRGGGGRSNGRQLVPRGMRRRVPGIQPSPRNYQPKPPGPSSHEPVNQVVAGSSEKEIIALSGQKAPNSPRSLNPSSPGSGPNSAAKLQKLSREDAMLAVVDRHATKPNFESADLTSKQPTLNQGEGEKVAPKPVTGQAYSESALSPQTLGLPRSFRKRKLSDSQDAAELRCPQSRSAASLEHAIPTSNAPKAQNLFQTGGSSRSWFSTGGGSEGRNEQLDPADGATEQCPENPDLHIYLSKAFSGYMKSCQ